MAGWFDDPPSPWDYPDQGGYVTQQGPQALTGAPPPSSNARTDGATRITELYQRLFGRNPTQRELSSYGNNVDDNYLRQIETQLKQSPEATQYTGTQTSTRLNSIYQKLMGRNATAEEAKAFGTNINEGDWGRIEQQLAGSPEAKTYEQNPKPPAGPATPTSGGEDWAGKDYSNIDNVKAYFKSRGVDVSDQSAQYWADKYNSPEFNKDRGYFFTRLGQAEEFGGGGGGGYGDLLSPFTENFSYQDFKAPTQADLLSSPGFQSSLDRASNTLQRSAAAKGSLLSGSTAQALSDQTADLTTQGYGNLFNQQAQVYQTNRGNAYDAYKERRANFYQNQDSPFAKLMALSSLQQQDLQGQRQINLGYAGLGSNNINSGAANYNGLLTGGANAAASGIVGSQNAYSSLYGNLSQYPWLLAAMRGNRGGGGYGSSGYGTGY